MVRSIVTINERFKELVDEVDEEELEFYCKKIQRLANYLAKNFEIWHRIEEYVETAPEYHRRL